MEQNILKIADSLENTAREIRAQFYQQEGEEALVKAISPGGIFHGKWAKNWEWYIGGKSFGGKLELQGHAPESATTELNKIFRIKNPGERLTLALDLNVDMISNCILSLSDSDEYREFVAYHEVVIQRVNTHYPRDDYRGIYNQVCDELDKLDAQRRRLGTLLSLMKDQLKREEDNDPF